MQMDSRAQGADYYYCCCYSYSYYYYYHHHHPFPAGDYLDILAISCDSFNEDVNVLIGRGQGKKNHVENLQKLRKWCRDYKVAFKINSVINRFNVDEDMNEHIKALNPVRWKVNSHCRLLDFNPQNTQGRLR